MSVLSRFFYGIQTNCNSATGDLLNLQYGYSATANNGNVQSQAITRGSQTWTDSYSYDGANRLNGASEGSGSWGQSFGFDGRGNRWLSSYSGLATPTAEVPLTASWYNANNQVGSWSYDGSGNILSIANMQRAFTYDAENRQVSAAINGQTTTYTYDGDGRRVIKVAPSVGTTVFVYDPFGNLAQEYGTPTDSGTKYLTTDALGSTRLVTNLDGSVEKSYDYLPFGEEIESGTAGRGTTFPGSPYPHSPATQDLEFTSKERDAETGLDFFGARYFSSAQGRFTSTDPKQFSSRTLLNPQKWNKYAYTLNNPLALVDPDGKEEVTIQFRAFIPQANVAGFRGDNRSFSSDANVRSRVSTTIRIETDPAKNGGNPLLGKQTDVGPTHLNITGQEKTSQGPMMPQVTATQDKNGNVTVNVQESMGNPFTSGVDPNGTIKSNMNITVNESATNAQFNGTVSGSPAFETNMSVNGGANQNVPLQSAPTNSVQFVLGLHSTNQINKSVELKKKEDQQ